MKETASRWKKGKAIKTAEMNSGMTSLRKDGVQNLLLKSKWICIFGGGDGKEERHVCCLFAAEVLVKFAVVVDFGFGEKNDSARH